MWSFFINHNKFAYLFVLVLIVIGSYSLVVIPKESSPEVIIPIGVVTTILPGAPAADTESLVTNEIERGLSTLENVKEVTSISSESVSTVIVEFEASADIDDSIQELKDQVDAITPDLPETAEDPLVSEVSFSDQPILTVALSADLSDRAFAELAQEIENELESISGVSRVGFAGVRDKEIAVILDQSALLRYELTLNQVLSAIRNANQTLPIGQIEHNGISYNVAFEGDLTDSNDILNVVVTTRGGQPVYVRDIATVEDGLTPATSLSRVSVDGNPSQNSISVNIYKQSGGDITTITAAVNERISELQEDGNILSNVEVLTVLDAGSDIQTDLIRLSLSGLQTVVLVVLLLVVAIGWREGLLAGTAIPLTFLFGFIGLYVSGNSINFLSLFSLILGIGILVDSAIVMIEGINRKMKEDQTIDKKLAAIQTVQEFKAPLISGTLTTVSMFAGLFIVSGIIGQFIASIPFTLIFLLFASMFVALAIIPLFASSFLHRKNTTTLEVKQTEYAHRFEDWYRQKLIPFIENEAKADRFLSLLFALLVFAVFLAINVYAGLVAALMMYFGENWLRERQHQQNWGKLRHRVVWFCLFFIMTIVAFGVTRIAPDLAPVEVTFFDQSDIEYVIVEIEEPEGTTKEVTDISARRIEELLYQKDDIASYVLTVGSGSDFTDGGTGEKLANFFVTLRDDREQTSTEFVTDLREELAAIRDVKVTVSQLSDGPPTGAAIVIKFLGDDLEEITEIANQAALVLRETDGVINVETSTNSNNTEYVLELDRAKAAAYGLDAFTVSQIARTAIFGADATSLTTLSDDITVVVKMNVTNSVDPTSENTNQATIDALARIELPTPSGETIPLSSVVDVSLRESSSMINHESGKRVVSIEADVAPDANARDLQVQVVAAVEEQVEIPQDVMLSTGGGETDESNQAFMEMFAALVVGILLMIGVLVLQFNSYLHTRYVLSILPYSLIGIFVGLAITQNSLSFPSMMGFIALSGIVVNNSILLIDMMNHRRRKNPTMSIKEVVVESAVSRLRPILLTTVTTVIGMLPLTYAGDLWAPLAYAVMFGLLFSILVTLVLIPITYYRKPGELG